MSITPNPNQYPANALWVELSTRITTQQLHYRSGNEETAAESVYKLFAKTRELMEKYPDAKEFRELGLQLLNDTLRPNTARWHGWMTELQGGKEAKSVFNNYQTRHKFRKELRVLIHILDDYQAAFRALADGQPVPPIPNAKVKNVTDAQLGVHLNAGIPMDGINDEYLININTEESKEIKIRRGSLDLPADTQLKNVTGLALSGGGIRSATFCLGIVQTLAKHGMFHQFDYLSTVSGGGYLGSFLSSTLIKGSSDEQKKAKDIVDELLIQHNGRESNAVHHLRNSSKYLGTGGIPLMAGLMVFGILTNLLLLLPVPLFAALIIYVLQNYVGFWHSPEQSPSLWFGLQASGAGYTLLSLMIATGIFGFTLPFIQSITHGKQQGGLAKFRSAWETSTLIAAIAMLIFALLYVLPEWFAKLNFWMPQLANVSQNPWPLLTTTVLPFLFAYSAKLMSAWRRTQKILFNLFVLSGPLFFVLVFFIVGHYLGLGRTDPEPNTGTFIHKLAEFCLFIQPPTPAAWVLTATAGLAIWGAWFVNINTSSPHRYYRNRLCDCYLLKRTGSTVESRVELPLEQLNPTGSPAPYHIVNTTINLTTSPNPELRGRNGDFFMISKHYCGSPVLGYSPTKQVVKQNPHIDLGSAMAISGAAASTNMGWQSMANFRFWLGLMNIRLGYWLLNFNQKTRVRAFEGPGPKYLFKEILGKMKETDRYVNLSDGGHIENLAVYELLRRRCKFIVCIDGGQEPGMECADLIRLQRYAEIDLGIRMEYDLTDLKLDNNRCCRSYAVLVKIRYNGHNTDLGWMMYIKLATTGTEPAYVTDYRRSNPDFPHQTTGDQFFDEAQFEAYRMLGEYAAEHLFRDELMEDTQPDTLQAWFQQLANNLLPDNDVVFKASLD